MFVGVCLRVFSAWLCLFLFSWRFRYQASVLITLCHTACSACLLLARISLVSLHQALHSLVFSIVGRPRFLLLWFSTCSRVCATGPARLSLYLFPLHSLFLFARVLVRACSYCSPPLWPYDVVDSCHEVVVFFVRVEFVWALGCVCGRG